MSFVIDAFRGLWESSGIALFIADPKALIMVAVACVLLYLAIVRQFEPLLLLPIAFGMLLTNLLGSEVFHEELFAGGHANWSLFGGAVLINAKDLVDAAALTVNAAGSVLDAAGNYIGHISGATGVTGNELVALQTVMEYMAGNGAECSIILNHAFMEGGIVYTQAGALLANAGREITPGLLDYLYLGVKLGIYPCLIFMGVGAGTDFAPLIANPKTLLLGAAAQLGIFAAFLMALVLGFEPAEAAAIGVIGGADGPTAILTASKLAVGLLPAIAIAAYSYMALIPLIQPPLMKALTTKEMRMVKMSQLRKVSQTEKIIFPIAVTIFVILLIPDTAPLIGMLMLGNLFRECGVTERLSDTAQNALINIVTIPLGLSVGFKADAANFLKKETLFIILLGLIAFMLSTCGGLLLGDLMYVLTKGKVNPLIGSAGVSAVPMAARVSQTVGQKENPSNFLLMHAMGPNVAGVIGSACAAGFMIKVFGG